ncbi:hypothetical protein GCM10023080_091770 [Streptomyces pseudoechinosporeus]
MCPLALPFLSPFLSLSPVAMSGIAAAFVAVAFLMALFEVDTVEFTGQQVRLISRIRTRTREVADLVSVKVVHSGSAESGYTQTSLRLAWQNWEGQEFDGEFDPGLADSLRRKPALGDLVEERWSPLMSSTDP